MSVKLETSECMEQIIYITCHHMLVPQLVSAFEVFFNALEML